MPPGLIRLLCVGALLAAPATALAKPATPELIDHAEKAGRVDLSQADLYRAYAVAAPERLPAAFRSDAPWDGTLALLRVRQDLPRLRAAAREEIQQLLAAAPSGPACDGASKSQANILGAGHFHITYDGVDAGLSVADYAASLERSWNTEVGAFGWAAPPVFTRNPAPGNRYHVRIDDLAPGLYGFVSRAGTYAGFVGDNPATTWNEEDAYASCMVLNRDYTGFPSGPQGALDSTTAHEFNHSIQFGYGALTGANRPGDVFVEGGATWMEDEVHDAANDNYFYPWPAFTDSMGEYDSPPYGYWITFRGLTERYGTGSAGGGEQVMQDFWELTSKEPAASDPLGAMDGALAARGTTLADAFHAYAIAVKFNRGCGGGYVHPYCFEEGPAYVATRDSTPVHGSIAAAGGTATGAVEDNYALAWVALPEDGTPYDVTVANTSSGGELRGTVACDTGSGLSLYPLPGLAGAGQSTTLPGFDPGPCVSRVAVITNQAQTAPPSEMRSFLVSTSAPTPASRIISGATGGAGATGGSATIARTGPVATVDRVAPVLGRLRLSPAAFRAARSGPALAALVGTRLSLSLSEAAAVTFRVDRLLPGRMVGGRCTRPTARNADARRCPRSVRQRGRIVRSLRAGVSTLRYRGRLAGRTLRPGRYGLRARAGDAAGNLSAVQKATFVVVG